MSCEKTVAKYWNCWLVTAWYGFTCASVAPHSGVSVPPVAAVCAGAAVGLLAGAVVAAGAAAGAVVGAAAGAAGGVVGLAAGTAVGGGLVGADGAVGAHAWSKAAVPERSDSRRSWRRTSMGVTSCPGGRLARQWENRSQLLHKRRESKVTLNSCQGEQ